MAYRRREKSVPFGEEVLANALRSLSLVRKEGDDPIKTHGYRRSAHALFKKTLPDLRFAKKELKKPRLALMYGGFEQVNADAKVALKAFKSVECVGSRKDTLRILDLIARELDWPESSNSTTQTRSDTARFHTPTHNFPYLPHSRPYATIFSAPGLAPALSWLHFRSVYSHVIHHVVGWKSRFRPVGNSDPSFRLFHLIVNHSPFQCCL